MEVSGVSGVPREVEEVKKMELLEERGKGDSSKGKTESAADWRWAEG